MPLPWTKKDSGDLAKVDASAEAPGQRWSIRNAAETRAPSVAWCLSDNSKNRIEKSKLLIYLDPLDKAKQDN